MIKNTYQDPAYVLGEDIVYRVVEGEAVLLDVGRGEHFSLNRAGTEILTFLDKKRSLDDLLTYQTNKYCLPKEDLMKDIDDCIADLLKNRVIKKG